MSYKEAVHESMLMLSEDEKVRFIGYSVRYGSMGYNCFKGIPEGQLIETPVAENLMTGLAIGMAIEGYKPILYFERFDFVLNALDGIVNHLDKINRISDKQYNPIVLIRIVIGGGLKKPLYTGPTHTQDFTEALRTMVTFPVVRLRTAVDVIYHYKEASQWKTCMALVEERDLYEA